MNWARILFFKWGILSIELFLFLFLMIVPSVKAEIVKGKVFSVQVNGAELDVGSAHGVGLDDIGRIYYSIMIDGKETPIYVGKFKVMEVFEKSSRVQIVEQTGEIRPGYGAELTIRVGELAMSSEPSGATVYLDGKKVGKTPTVVSKVPPGRHRIRLEKEGFEPYAVEEEVGAERRDVAAKMRARVEEGGMVVLSEPGGASVFMDGRLVGQTPYEGKALLPKAYKLRVVKEGYEAWERNVDIEEGKKVEVYAQLKGGEGSLEVWSEPSGAKVWVNGKEMGVAPLVTPVKAGQYLVRVFREGYEVHEEWVQMEGGGKKEVRVSLKEIFGNLTIQADQPGAVIYLDGKVVGKGTYQGKGLTPKVYRVGVAQEGYENWEKDVLVEEGKRVEVIARLGKKEKEGTVTSPEPGRFFTDPVTGMEFVFIKGGCYQRGDTFGDGDSDEKPVHEVCVDDFFMGKYEVTQGQWKGVMGSNPSSFNNCGSNCPVERISWNDVQEFISRLNQRSGKRFRLPTEAEWEYAARSGGKREKWSGTSSEGELGEYAWYKANSGNRTHPVGEKRPNGLGIYDMTGNVWELCSDRYAENYYNGSPRNNPKGPIIGSSRVNRGGAWNNDARSMRAANRGGHNPAGGHYDDGFRLCFSSR
jgi:formylglycine-generating enzyme